MEDLPHLNVTVPASPSINSVLKPPKPRHPLKDIMTTAHEEDNTAARKRRVSFANVNKIKEFSAGAESMVVCHTPAYEEPFSTMSSDSSCPSGAEGWTPAKTEVTNGRVTFSTQKENSLLNPLLAPQVLNYHRAEGIMSDSGMDRMSLTSCVGRLSTQNSGRFSIGMDLTEVVQSSNSFVECLDLTKSGRKSYQPLNNTTCMSSLDETMANDSCELELTDAIVDPRLSTRYSTATLNLSCGGNNDNYTRYSTNSMDITNPVISHRPSLARSSQRFSLGVRELDSSVSGLEITEGINDPSILATRYSVNDMEFTEAIDGNDLSKLTTKSSDMEFTEAVDGNDLTRLTTKSSDMEFTEGNYENNITKLTTKSNDMELTEAIDENYVTKLSSKSVSCTETAGSFLETSLISESVDNLKSVDAKLTGTSQSTVDEDPTKHGPSHNSECLDSNHSGSDSEDTPTTQTYNGGHLPLSPLVTPNVAELKEIETNSNLSKDLVQAEHETNKVLGDITNQQLQIVQCNEEYPKENICSEIFVQQTNSQYNADCSSKTLLNIEEQRNIGEDKLDVIDSSKEVTIGECSGARPNIALNCIEEHAMNNHFDNVRQGTGFNKENTNNFSTICMNDMIETEHITLVNDESMELSEPLVLSYVPLTRKSVHPVEYNLEANEAESEISRMDVSYLSPRKAINESLLPESYLATSDPLNLEKDQSVVKFELQGLQNVSQTQLNNSKMELSFTECEKGEDYSNLCNLNKTDLSDNKQPDLELSEQEENAQNSIDKVSTLAVNNAKIIQDVACKVATDVDTPDNQSLVEHSPLLRSTYCDRNITMSRGMSLRYSCDSTNFSLDTSNQFEQDNIREQSELESSLPLIQRLQPHKQASGSLFEVNEAEHNFKDLPPKDKGGKRSFEVALEPENDAEESPVKQICLANAFNCSNSDQFKVQTNASCDQESEFHNPIIELNQTKMGTSSANETNPIHSNVNEERAGSCSSSNKTNTLIETRNKTNLPDNNFSLRYFLPTIHKTPKGQSLGSVQTSSYNISGLQFMEDEENDDSSAGQTVQEKQNDTHIDNLDMQSAKRKHNDSQDDNFQVHSLETRQNTSPTDISKHKDISGREKLNGILNDNSELHAFEKRQNISPNDISICLDSRSNISSYNISNQKTINYKIDEQNRSEFRHNEEPYDASRHHEVNSTAEDLSTLSLTNQNVYPPVTLPDCGADQSLLRLLERANTNKEETNSNSRKIANKRVTPRTIIPFRTKRTMRDEGHGIFVCDWILRWVQLRFTIATNGAITGCLPIIICPDKEKAIGAYIAQQVMSAPLPTNKRNLISEVKEPSDSSLSLLANHLSHICKFLGGTLNGNILTLEVVCCKEAFWAFISVNIKYPKDLREEDITISEHRMGELKLSRVRQMFASFKSDEYQLFNFAQALTVMQFS